MPFPRRGCVVPLELRRTIGGPPYDPEAQTQGDLNPVRNPRDFGAEGVQLVRQRIDRIFQFEDLPLHIHRYLLRKITLGNSRGHLRDISHLRGKVSRHQVN